MAEAVTPTEGAARQIAFQKKFRARFVAETPGWYHGLIHLGFTLVVTIGIAVLSWVNIAGASVWEWLVAVPIFLFGNWCEWAGHRWPLHHPVPGLRAVYLRHAGVHHQFFTNHDLSYKGHREWRAQLFPPFAPVAFMLVAAVPAALLWAVWSANAGLVAMFTMATYFVGYEVLHGSAHLVGPRWRWLAYVPLVNTVRYMHVAHHDLELMQNWNFNLTFPICDALFGTSTLDRGLLGTLFNGEDESHLRAEIRRQTPPDDVGARAEAA